MIGPKRESKRDQKETKKKNKKPNSCMSSLFVSTHTHTHTHIDPDAGKPNIFKMDGCSNNNGASQRASLPYHLTYGDETRTVRAPRREKNKKKAL